MILFKIGEFLDKKNIFRLRHSPEHIYQSIGSDVGLQRTKSDLINDDSERAAHGDFIKHSREKISEKIPSKNENHDSGRSVSPPPRRFFSREGSVESSGS